ncbi:hypothetical protein GCM10010909_07130 [Acidocella aquatica]|uniref:Uncharacterized protein n=1 Tax=Acidocella aquatica TaxID=1922313 RepID=A0ABQ6A7J5_9PROT|nr:hypothetical protein GCM10010909_07130 [Acidocella aquatica]
MRRRHTGGYASRDRFKCEHATIVSSKGGLRFRFAHLSEPQTIALGPSPGRVIGITPRLTGIEQAIIGLGERRVIANAFDKVGV